MSKDNQLYLNDILDAIGRIKKFTKDIGLEKFIEDELVHSAVIRQLEIVGEAANKISKELQEEFDSIPWREIIGTRNKLIHDYSGVDLVLVWNIVEKELDDLEKGLKRIFEVKGYKRLKKKRSNKAKKLLAKLKKEGKG
ncbi:DUF86 domain-containing protein [Natroniella sulfidigena]|uniref:HepT-like ribonuclease domain-containing protein n=1 Tax=Natroniella sulfidigena TaxID=723921 RepID=UPI00200B5ECC|nr:DUF86 domain-containing protein [Natroniella sulfidigena]MCK8817589.1 DUF86 domain-containing protein [Natroniella sulfidigena]